MKWWNSQVATGNRNSQLWNADDAGKLNANWKRGKNDYRINAKETHPTPEFTSIMHQNMG